MMVEGPDDIMTTAFRDPFVHEVDLTVPHGGILWYIKSPLDRLLL